MSGAEHLRKAALCGFIADDGVAQLLELLYGEAGHIKHLDKLVGAVDAPILHDAVREIRRLQCQRNAAMAVEYAAREWAGGRITDQELQRHVEKSDDT